MKAALTLLCCSLAMTYLANAQNQIDQVDSTGRNFPDSPFTQKNKDSQIPVLYEGELEDIGPQYLLLEKAKRDWFKLFADLQVYSSNNAGLFENNPESTDIIAATAQIAIIPYVGKYNGGDVTTRVGYREQHFFYGAISGSDQTVNGTPAKNLDFNNRQPFADVTYERGPLTLKLGIHYSELLNRETSDQFYSEIAPAWSASYDIEVSPKALVTLSYFGSYRSTKSESFGLLPKDWNDQIKQGLSATYSRLLKEKWILQTSLGVTHSEFESPDRDREDLLRFFNLSIVHIVSDEITLRIYTSYEARNSSEPTTEDYNNWNLGTAVSLNWGF
jgi:hypothetical protein